MAKQLITPRNVREYLKENTLYVDKDMILSPSVKDYCKEEKIALIYGEGKLSKEKKDCDKESTQKLYDKVVGILEKDFNISDKNLVELILKRVEGEMKSWE